MKIKRYVGGSLESNGYIVYAPDIKECYIIDPGYNPEKFKTFVTENELNALGIILTHFHHDHVGAAEALRDRLSCPVMMHSLDTYEYKGTVDKSLTDGDSFALGDETLHILHTPGHTEGSICIFAERSKACFTGDTIFDTDLGRTDLHGGSEEKLRRSIIDVVDKWGNDVTIYPGHDRGCTMKCVRRNNYEFLTMRNGHERE